MKEAKKQFSTTWSLVKNVPAYKAGSRRRNLRLEEKTDYHEKQEQFINEQTGRTIYQV